MDDLLQLPGAASPFSQQRGAEPFGEHLALATRYTAPEPPHEEPKLHAASRTRQIRGLADMVALDKARGCATQRAVTGQGGVASIHHQRAAPIVNAVHGQPERDQRRKAKPGCHGTLLP